jgi:hypothetical protein
MYLKNYTSEVAVDVTIPRIEKFLVAAGADGIQKMYTNERLTAIMFLIDFEPGKQVTIRLPSNADKCTDALWQDYQMAVPKGRKTRDDFIDQGERTAWKLVQDWVEVQISLIKLKQVETLQVFLGYVWDGEKDFYTQVKNTQYRALLSEPKKSA